MTRTAESGLRELIACVEDLGRRAVSARAAGVQASRKQDRSLVTEVDFMIESALFDHIRAAFPDDGFAGEEGYAVESRSGRTWLVDPIDGTQQFVRGQDFWGILVACVDGDRPVLGVIAHPARQELLWAVDGQGCYERVDGQDVPLRVSACERIDESYLLHNGIEFARRAGRLDQLSVLTGEVGAERGYADSFGHTEVIRGRADIMIDFMAQPHDIAAVAVCVNEAGGQWSGLLPSHTVHNPGNACVTSNGTLHEAIVHGLRAQAVPTARIPSVESAGDLV